MVSIYSRIDVYPALGKSEGAMTLVGKQPVKSSFPDSYMRPGENIYNSSTEFCIMFVACVFSYNGISYYYMKVEQF